MDQVDCVVIGAGVIGLAIARKMALNGLETVVLEREKSFGTITSARNSEVIHAGIYYPKNSLKARLCVEGNRLLYDYLQTHSLPYNPCGKLIVSSGEEQNQDLEAIYIKAQQNEVPLMKRISQDEVRTLEPHLRCADAIFSGSTGVIDSHSYMLSLLGGLEDAGGVVAYQTQLEEATPLKDGASGFKIKVSSTNQEEFWIGTRYLINCAGLSAPAVARKIESLKSEHIPTPYFAKGNYFSLQAKAPFKRLIYPIPEPGGLGVHLTLDMGGQAKFGPDVEWLDIEDEAQINYQVSQERGELFYAAIRKYWPDLPDNALTADYSGVRSKIVSKDIAFGDFLIQDQSIHQLSGLINLFGFESPGLTSSLAIANQVAQNIRD
ncbi:MAG: NAD(P)/FAD-dependent oxidoreductase [Betaproteobacteria bacterium]